MTSIAKHIIVDRDEHGAPRLRIDDFVFDFATAGITVPAPSLDEAPTVTVTFVAEKVTMVNEPWPEQPADGSPERWTCTHPGCIGAHTSGFEVCC